MPIYEYQCNHCGNQFEKIVGFSEANNATECPDCQSSNTHKRISAVASFSAGSTSFGLSTSSPSSGCGSSGGFG